MLGRVVVGWAALGVTLTGATQLRMEGLPLGPGEALLAFWMGFVAFCLLRKVPFGYSGAFRPFATFWLIAAVLLGAGSLVSVGFDRQHGPTAGHDALAFAFVAPLTCFLAMRVGDISDEQYYLRLARATFFAISAMGLLLLTASLATSQLGPIDFWYGRGTRFRGWSENPNQLAMFMVPMPFLGWYLLQRAQGLPRRLLDFLAISVCMAVGLATDSDALKVAWAGAAGLVGIWLWCRLLVRGRGNFLQMAIGCFVVPVLVLTFMGGLGDRLVAQFVEISEQVYEKGDRGQIGMMVLMNGLEAIRHSPFVGWGPGAYSGIYRSFDGFEAHNTLVDWGMSTGVLGMLLFLGLLFWCTVRVIRSGSPWLLGALVAIVSDTLFGYSLRHPMFWLMLVLIAALPEPTARRTASSARLPRKGTMSAPARPAYGLTMIDPGTSHRLRRQECDERGAGQERVVQSIER